MADHSSSAPVMSDACDMAMRDVEHGFALIEKAPADDRILLPLIATKEAINVALVACKAEQPEQRLKRQKQTIEEQIERMEEAILPPMPRMPGPSQQRRRRSNNANLA